MKEGFFSKAKEVVKKAVKTGGLIAATGAALVPKESEAQTQKPKERQPIFVVDSSDSQMKTYVDSLEAYNFGNKEMQKIIDKTKKDVGSEIFTKYNSEKNIEENGFLQMHMHGKTEPGTEFYKIYQKSARNGLVPINEFHSVYSFDKGNTKVDLKTPIYAKPVQRVELKKDLYQGYDFIQETGLTPGYHTKEEVEQAKIKKLQEKIKKDLGK